MISGLLDRELQRDGTRPFLTWYDDTTSERVELSVATTANWAAKIANHLMDVEDLQAGDDVVIDPTAHWTTAMVLLGAWTAGGHVVFGDPVTLEFDRDAMGLGLSRLVGAQPDQLVMPAQASGELALTIAERTWSHDELAAAAVHAASHHGFDRASRILSTLGLDTVDGLDAALLVPLAAGGSVVLVGNADPTRQAERCATERVTHTAGVDVPGLARLDG